jgi:hypothetical protein
MAVRPPGVNRSLSRRFLRARLWEGVVQVFALLEHPTATRCYAWSHEIEGSKKRRFFAVLHQGVVDSPEKAVRAAIIKEHQEQKGML